jgi:hypothetical protein
MESQTKYAEEIDNINEEIRKESNEAIKRALRQRKQQSLILLLRETQVTQRNLSMSLMEAEFSKQEKLTASGMSILTEKGRGLGIYGIGDRDIRKEQALSQVRLDMERERIEIEKLARSGQYSAEEIQKLTDNLTKLNEIKLENIKLEFGMFTDAIRGVKGDVEGIFKDFFMNTKGFGDSIMSVLDSILNNLASMSSRMLADQLFGSLFGMGGRQNQGVVGSGLAIGLNSVFGGLFYNGGMVGDIAKGLSQERAMSGFKPQLIIANEGERVLTPEEAKIWNQMQSSNGINNYSSGGTIGKDIGNINTINSGKSGDSFNISPTVIINESGGGDISKGRFEKVLEAKIQETIKQERRPGGSLNRGGLYDR